MKKPLLLLLIAAVVAGCYYGWWLPRNQHPPGEITLYGNVDIREVNLGFRVSGRIQEIRKDEGDSVKAGEVVALLDAEPYRRQVEQSRGEAASLKARLSLVRAGNRAEDIAQARAAVEERRAAVDNAQRIFERRKALVAKNVAAQQEYDDSVSNLDQARARLNSGIASLKAMETGFRPEEIAQAEAECNRVEAALRLAELNLVDTELKSPSDGVVTTRALEPGAVVQAGPTVLTVALSSPVWVRAYIPEADLGKVHPGMSALVYTDSRPNHPYQGQVGFVSPRAEFTPKSVETTDLRTGLVYRLRVVISKADEELRQGMPATVKLRVR